MNPWSRLAILLIAAALLPILGGAALAAERGHGAHVHGVGQLNLVVEGRVVAIELISPGANIVGFEHEAKSPEDRASVDEAVAILEDGASLFAFPAAAGCRLEEADVQSVLMEDGQAEHEGEDQDHADHDHGDHDHGDHDHGDHEHADHENEAHAEFHVRYRFDCDDPSALSHVDVKLFERFPATEELDVQAVSPGGQSAAELTAAATRLTF